MARDAERFRQLCEKGGCHPLAARTLIRVTGADRLRYLNGQMSNDLRRLAPGQAMPALVLNAKGKLSALVYVWIDGEALIVESSAGLEETLLARLERYAIADDVTFEPIDPAPSAWHVFGAAAEGLEGRKITRLGIPGVDLESAPAGLLQADAAEWELLRIRQGVPAWGSEITEDTLPQEARLETWTVDFHKGCYVGQEVVSRLKSVGRVNRLLTGFLGHFTPSASGELTLENAADQKVGRLTSFSPIPGSPQSAALGYLSSREEGTHFSVVDESGACLGAVERCEFPLIF